MHNSAGKARAKPPGTSAPASTTASARERMHGGAQVGAAATNRSASVHARSFIPRSFTVILHPTSEFTRDHQGGDHP